MTRIKPLLHLVFVNYFLCKIKGDWVDPYSMDTSVKSKIKSSSYKDYDLKEEYCSSIRSSNSDLYLKRIIRLILNNAYLDKEDFMDYFTGHVNLKFSKKEYEFLMNFSMGDETKEEILSEVNSIFEIAFQKPSLDRYKDAILTLEEQLYFLIFNATTGALVSSLLLLYVIYKLLRANFTWWSILKYLSFLLYIADFGITYLEIRKDDEVKTMVAFKSLGAVPPECDPKKLSWWGYVKTQFESTFIEHPCKAYYEVMANTDLKYLVAPTRILTRQFKGLFVEPIGDLGEAFGKFGRHMFTNLPWGLNVALFPIMLLASILIIFTILLFITKPRFKISIFHFFTLEIGDTPRPERGIEDRPVGRAIQRISNRREVGYNEQHRALIEEASNDNYSSNEQHTNEVDPSIVQECIGANEEQDSQIIQKTINKEEDGNTSSSVDNIGSDSLQEIQS